MKKILFCVLALSLSGCHRHNPSDPVHDTTVTNLSGPVTSDTQSIQIPSDAKIQGVSTCGPSGCHAMIQANPVIGAITYMAQASGGNAYVVIYHALNFGETTWNISYMH